MRDLLTRWLLPEGSPFNRVELLWRDLPPAFLVLALGLLLLALAFTVAAALRTPRAPRLGLVLLRGLTALILLLVVLGPALERQEATRVKGRVAVLLDVSRSMSLREGGVARLDHARALAAEASRALASRFLVETYAFDRDLRPVESGGLAALAAEGARTDLSGALGALQADDQGGGLAGIVLLSDGVDTARLQAVGDVARRRPEWPGAPVFPIQIGDADRFKDLALVELRHDPLGFVRHPLSFDVKLQARGFDGRRVDVTLRQDGQLLTSRAVTLKGELARAPLTFQVTPDRPGTYLYSIEVAPAPEEEVVENNRVEFAVAVGRDQTRVLLICGRPSWDERFLRQMLKQDPNIDLVSFFILRDEEDVPGVPQDELSLIPFPVNDLFTTELESFDVVILQNFNRGFSRGLTLTGLHLDNLREFVVTRGGGLLLIGGDLGMRAGGYSGSALEEVLPFTLSGGGPEADEGAFLPEVTESGLTHFITALEPELGATKALFAALPALDGSNVVGPLQGGASALLVHPRLTAGGAPMPVLAARQAGKGRTLALTADTTWYWNYKVVGRGGSNRDYLRLWQNALRWLAQDPSAKFLSLSLGAETIEPGQALSVRVRALRGDYSPLPAGRIHAALERASARSAQAGGTGGQGGGAGAPGGGAVAPPAAAAGGSFDGLTDASGVHRFEVAPREEGFYRVRAELLDPRGSVLDRDQKLFEVKADRTELHDPGLNRELLEAIAGATGGRVLEPGEASRPPIPDRPVYRLGERQRIELWDNGLVYALLVALLVAEWWLRRRAGLA